MFVTDNICYIQLQKTACTHIAKLLSRTVGGEQRGKHNRPTVDLLESSRVFVASIRNPWEWYVSLWCYGCDGMGGFRQRVTTKRIHRCVRDFFHHRRVEPFARAMVREIVRDARIWRGCYGTSSDPEMFRRWIYRVHDPENRFDLGEGYGYSSICDFAGFYTFRMLRLCCGNVEDMYSGRIATAARLREFDEENSFVTEWIRNEHLERDFLEVLDSSGSSITQEQKEHVLSCAKSNTSSRTRGTASYYDRQTIDLVGKREALIVEKFDYSPPPTEI